MLKNLLKKVGDRIFPSIQANDDGTGHCHEAAFDPESFSETIQQKLRKGQSLSAKKDIDSTK